MAITDNTAKWQVKKITNFTDKEREIATQAQAEEGVDNTKVMTPLRTKSAIDKQRPLKTYTTFEQLGFSSMPTLIELIEAMPHESQFTRYIRASEKDIIGIPDGGILEITRNKGSYNYASLRLQKYGGNDVVTKMWFASWGGGQAEVSWKEVLSDDKIATQVQAEQGTNNSTVMTPLRTQDAINSQRPLKTYTAFEQLGFSSVPTLIQLLEALPINSEFTSHISTSDNSIVGLPNAGILVITKGYNVNYAKVQHYQYGGEGIIQRAWYCNWGKGQTTFNWRFVGGGVKESFLNREGGYAWFDTGMIIAWKRAVISHEGTIVTKPIAFTTYIASVSQIQSMGAENGTASWDNSGTTSTSTTDVFTGYQSEDKVVIFWVGYKATET